MNPFQPQFASAQSTPPAIQPQPAFTNSVQAPAAAPAQPSKGLDDPTLYQGHNTPLLPNKLDGRWACQVLSVVGSKGYESGHAVHITLGILSSTNPNIKQGETYRVFYKFNYTTMEPVEGKQGTVHAGLLGKFVAALYGRDHNDPQFSKTEALASICTNARGGAGHDFNAAPGFVELFGELRDREQTDAKTGAVSKSRLRSDMWLPYKPAASAA